MYWGQSYQPVTSNTACDGIIASNKANFGQGVCQGRYGYFVVGNGVVNTGADTQSAQAFYFQDSWQVGRGLTLNLGIRLDQETQPPFDPTRFPTVQFGWGDKMAPRLGGAYDVHAQRQAQGVCQLRPVLRHHEARPGARFLRQRLLAQLRVRHGRSELHQHHPVAIPSAAVARPAVRRPA